MRALVRTAAVVVLGVGLVLAAIHRPDLRFHLAGSGSTAGASPSTGPASRAVTRAVLVCPGPETVGVKGVDAKTAVAPTTVRVAAGPSDVIAGALGPTSPSASAGSVDGVALGGPGDLGLPPLAAPGTTSVRTSAARSVLLTGSGSLAPGLAAAQTTLVTTGDQRGLAMSACRPPRAESWLVGGGGEPGRRGRVVLTNPSPTGVTVDLIVYGAKGQVRSAAARGIVVAAHQRTVVLLDAIAPGEPSPVIHVVASGGLVSAALHDSWLDGTTPAGADDVVGTDPGARLVIPAVLVSGPGGSTTLRVAAPAREAVVRVRLLGADGPIAAPVNNGVVRVPAHQVKDVDLSTVTPGYYGVQITSDQPVVAGAQVRPPADPASPRRDLTWTSAQPEISALAGVPLGDTAAPWAKGLVLSAPTEDAALDLVTVAADGSESTQAVTVAAGTTKVLSLTTAGASIWLRVHTGSVAAALTASYADPAGRLRAVAPLSPATLLTTSVAVHPLGG